MAAMLLKKAHAIHPEQFLLCFNSGLKFKLYNSATHLCRKTVLGPSFTDDIKEIRIIPSPGDANYMAFSSKEKVIGIIQLPLDGNPHRAMGLIAHPSQVSHITPTPNGTFLLTAGGDDCTVYMWLLNYNILETQVQLAGEGLKPFLGMLDDSGLEDKGPAYRELEDYFYYAQLRR